MLIVGEVDIFVGRNYILSVRHARSSASPTCAPAASASRSCCEHGSGFVLYALMDNVVDRYFPVLDALETSSRPIEEQIFERERRARQHRGALRAEAASS